MHRKVLGFIALGLLVVGMGLEMLHAWNSTGTDPETPQTLAGALVRIGFVFAALWLAAPQRLDQIDFRRILPRLGVVAAVIAAVLMPRVAKLLIAATVKLGPILMAVGFVLYLLKPSDRRRTRPR